LNEGIGAEVDARASLFSFISVCTGGAWLGRSVPVLHFGVISLLSGKGIQETTPKWTSDDLHIQYKLTYLQIGRAKN
jgi:hypothetical protein